MRADIILSLDKGEYSVLKTLLDDLADVANAIEIKEGEFNVEFVEIDE